MYISSEGQVKRSDVSDVTQPGGLRKVFSFVVNMMETAMKSTPNASPSKGEVLEKEVYNFDKEVWAKVFDSALIVDDDDNMEDVIDLSV